MRHGRAKQARRTLQFFQRTIGLGSHMYHILVDGTFVVALLQTKLLTVVQERMERLLQHGSSHTSIHFAMTQSSLDELHTLAEHQRQKTKTSNNKNQSTKDALNVFEQAHEWAQENCSILSHIPSHTHPDVKRVQIKMSHQQQSTVQTKKKKRRRRRQNQDEEEEEEEDHDAAVLANWTVAQQDMVRLVTDAVLVKDSSSNATKDDGDDKNDKATKETSQSLSSSQPQQRRKTVYFVATQDETLLHLLRQFPIPLIRLAHGSVLLLEQPSKTIQWKSQELEHEKWNHPTTNKTTTSTSSNQERQEQDLIQHATAKQEEQEKTKQKEQDQKELQQWQRQQGGGVYKILAGGNNKKRKAKGPNPLSCKKAKSTTSGEGTKRRRRRASGQEQEQVQP